MFQPEINRMQELGLISLADQKQIISTIRPILLAQVLLARTNNSTCCESTFMLAKAVLYKPCQQTSTVVRFLNGMVLLKTENSKFTRCYLSHRFSALKYKDDSVHISSRRFLVSCDILQMPHFSLLPDKDSHSTVIVVTGKKITIQIDCSATDNNKITRKDMIHLMQDQMYVIHPSCFITIMVNQVVIAKSLAQKSYAGTSSSLMNFYSSTIPMYKNLTNVTNNNPHFAKLTKLIEQENKAIEQVRTDAKEEAVTHFSFLMGLINMAFAVFILAALLYMAKCLLSAKKQHGTITDQHLNEINELRIQNNQLHEQLDRLDILRPRL